MAKITGLGGIFIKARNPQELAAWYQEKLGINFKGNVYTDFPFTDEAGKITPGFNIISFFDEGSAYFIPSEKKAMLNLRVDDLKTYLEELKSKGVTIVGDMLDEEYGKFGWVLDPEGNKIELWEPPTAS